MPRVVTTIALFTAVFIVGVMVFILIAVNVSPGPRKAHPATKTVYPAVKADRIFPTFVGRWSAAGELPTSASRIRTIPLAQAEDPPVRVKVEKDLILPPEPVPEKEHVRRRETRMNICERHNMRKVSIRHGRSWRCQR